VAAILLLAFNDHVGKGLLFLPDILRGKLSDVAGLFFFPIFLFALVEVCCRHLAARHRSAVAWICALVTAAVFAAIKTSAGANALVARWWGAAVLDPTDLLALPAVVLAVVWLLRRHRHPSVPGAAWARLCALGLAAFFSIATPAPSLVRRYPEWRILADNRLPLTCATAHAWVSKTGKEGLGLTVRITPTAACAVTVRDARLLVDGQEVVAASLPPRQTMREAEAVHVYLAFPFDGQAVWNRQVRTAKLRLTLAGGTDVEPAAPVAWELPLFYRLDSSHVYWQVMRRTCRECRYCPR
jgi:hypothetical protein